MTSFPAEWGVPSPGWRWRRVLPGPKHPAASLSHSQSHWLAHTDWKLRSGDANSRDKKKNGQSERLFDADLQDRVKCGGGESSRNQCKFWKQLRIEAHLMSCCCLMLMSFYLIFLDFFFPFPIIVICLSSRSCLLKHCWMFVCFQVG